MNRVSKTFVDDYSHRSRRVSIGDEVEIDRCKGHVVSLGKRFIYVVLYPNPKKIVRIRIDPLSREINWLKTKRA